MFFNRSFLGWVTFPGVLSARVLRHVCADIASVPVRKVLYFSSPDVEAVELGEAADLRQALWLTLAPSVAGLLLCVFFTVPYVAYALVLNAEDAYPITFFFSWLGYSIGMHSLPDLPALDRLVEKSAEAAEAGRGGSLYRFCVFTRSLCRFIRSSKIVFTDLFFALFVSFLGFYVLLEGMELLKAGMRLVLK